MRERLGICQSLERTNFLRRKHLLDERLNSPKFFTSSSNGFYQLRDVQGFLKWASLAGFTFHGTTREINGNLLPSQAHDRAKASGNKNAVYMTANPMDAMFLALTGGKDVGGRQNFCSMWGAGDRIIYSSKGIFTAGDPIYRVGNLDAIADEGFVYILDASQQSREVVVYAEDYYDRFVGIEYSSDVPVLPLAAVKVSRSDFPYSIESKFTSTGVARFFPRIGEEVYDDRSNLLNATF